MNISGIYQIKNKVNGEYYIGSSVDIHKRWKQHRNSALTGSKKCPLLYNAIRKYGIENFDFQIISTHEKSNLIIEEQKLLDVHINDEKCYNVAKFADNPTRGRSLTENHKISLRKPKSNVQNMGHRKGIKLTTEHKQNIAKSLVGKKKSKQHIENIVKAITGKSKNYNGSRNGQNNPHSKLTLEQVQEIKKLSNLQQGKYNMYKKLANQFNVSWGTIRNVVEGITYAS